MQPSLNEPRDFTGFGFRTFETKDLDETDRRRVFALFESNYRSANHAYLEKSFGTLRYISIAMLGDTPAGFSLGELRVMDLPRLPQTPVTLAGICCVAPDFRRRGLFAELERRSMMAGAAPPAGRWMSVGRMAHPASMRLMMKRAGVVPVRGVRPSDWHQAVGKAIAEAYGVERFDPETFVCMGGGEPIGYPVIEMPDVTPEEWELFRHVDRERGDSLLGLCWAPDAPAGW